jgi:hypothetical protein
MTVYARCFVAHAIHEREIGFIMAGYPKPADRRLRRNFRNEVGEVVPPPVSRPVPLAEVDWLPETVTEWNEYWVSDVSGLVNSVGDVSALRRLFNYRDEHTRALRMYRENRTALGSHKQEKTSPAGMMMIRLEKVILLLEDRYGLSALARLRLGAQLGGATKSLTEMNAALANEVTEDDGGNDEEPPDAEVFNLPGLPKGKDA